MEPHRISVKLYLDGPAPLDPEAVVPAFHRFIREDAVGGIPIDVAWSPDGTMMWTDLLGREWARSPAGLSAIRRFPRS